MNDTAVLEKDGLRDGEEMKGRPETLDNELYLSDLISLTPEDILKIPTKKITGDLSLRKLESVPLGGLELTEIVDGSVDLYNLLSTLGLKLPKKITRNLHLSNVESIEGLKLPEEVGGVVYLTKLSIDEKNELRKKYDKLNIV